MSGLLLALAMDGTTEHVPVRLRLRDHAGRAMVDLGADGPLALLDAARPLSAVLEAARVGPPASVGDGRACGLAIEGEARAGEHGDLALALACALGEAQACAPAGPDVSRLERDLAPCLAGETPADAARDSTVIAHAVSSALAEGGCGRWLACGGVTDGNLRRLWLAARRTLGDWCLWRFAADTRVLDALGATCPDDEERARLALSHAAGAFDALWAQATASHPGLRAAGEAGSTGQDRQDRKDIERKTTTCHTS